MNFARTVSFLTLLTFATAASAQVVPTVPGQSYLAIVGDNSQGGICAGANCVSPQRGIPFSYFASSDTVSNQFAGLNSQLTSQFATMNAQLRQATEYTSAVAALKDAIPAPGDRFALRINTAAVGGIVAGGIAFSANLDEQFRVSLDYGATHGQQVVSGGLNFSFN